MKPKTSIIPSGLIGIFYLLILISCEEAALPINGDGTPLSVDTVSFPVISTITYQTPPNMGDSEYLYFGKKDDYEFLYTLLTFDSVAIGGGYPFEYYNDSLIIADSMKLTLRFTSDSIDNNSQFQLRFFPQSGDSVFNEYETNYKNFDPVISSKVISQAEMVSDSIDSVNTKVTLNFIIDTTVINVFKDTSFTNFNRSFLIELKDNQSSQFKFHSSELGGGDGPELKLYYRTLLSDTVVTDSSYRTYSILEDLSVIKPPLIISDDTTYISVGRAKGLKSLVLVDMEGWALPNRSVIKSAQLILNRVQTDTINGFSVNSYPLNIDGVYSAFNFYDVDPYKVDIDLMASSSIVNNILKINHRKVSTEIGRGRRKNYGFKLQSNTNNDPFKIINFHSLLSGDYYPVMRVLYVRP